MSILYTYNNKNAFLVESDDCRKGVAHLKGDHKRRCYVLFIPQASSDATIAISSASKLSPLVRAYSSCLELAHTIFQPFSPKNVEAIIDLDSYSNQTAPQTPAVVLSAAFSILPLVHALNSGEEVSSDSVKCHLMYDFLPGSFFAHHRDGQYQFSFWNLYLCVVYAVAFDSADSISNSYFCLTQYLLRSSPDSRKAKVTVSHSVSVWNQELLWRLINSLLSTLAVVHAAGLHYGGQITTDDIVCFAIPRQLSIQLENTLNSLRDKFGRDEWGVDAIKSFMRTINSNIILPSAIIVTQAPVHRTFFTLTCIPRSSFSNHSNASLSEFESCQQKDLNCVGKILLSIIEAQKASNVTTDTPVSSELEFFIQRMCGPFSSSAHTTTSPVLYMTRLQALRLRANSWFHCLLAEETHLLACYYLQLHRVQGQSVYGDTKSEVQKKLDTQKNKAILKEEAAHLVKYEAEINAKVKFLEARENELSNREKKLEAILALYELTYAHLDQLPDAENAGYSELQRQLCDQLMAKDLHHAGKTDYTPSPNSMPSPRSKFTSHIDRDQPRFMKSSEVDDRNDTSSLVYHHRNDLSGEMHINEASSQVVPQLSSAPHFSFSVPVGRTSPDKTNRSGLVEISGKTPLNPTEVIKGGMMNEKGTAQHLDPHSNFNSNQTTSSYSISEGEKLFSSKGVEPYATKLPSQSYSRDIAFQQPAYDDKNIIDCIYKVLPNAHDSVPSLLPNATTGTPLTPPKNTSNPQEKPPSGSIFYSPPSPSKLENRSPSFRRSDKPIDGNSPCEAHTNGTPQTGDMPKGPLGDFHDDDRYNSHCTPKHPVPETLRREDRSSRSKYSTMQSNMKIECADTSNSSLDVEATPEHINRRRVLVPKLSGVLLDIESFFVPEHTESAKGSSQLKTPCTWVNGNQDSKEQQSCRELRSTRVKTDLDQDWIQLHYAELEKMQNKFRQDSAPGRNMNAARSTRTTPRSFKVVKRRHSEGVSREGRDSHQKSAETSTKGENDSNPTLKCSSQKQVEGHQQERERNIMSAEIEVVTEEVPKCVELSPNKPPVPSHHHSSTTELSILNHSPYAVYEPSLQNLNSLTNSASRLPKTATDPQIKPKTPKEVVSTTKMATSRRGASLSTHSTSSLLSLYASEKYPSKEQQKGVKSHKDSRTDSTDVRKLSSNTFLTSKLTTPRRNLNSSSPSLASSQALSSIHLRKHVEMHRQPQFPLSSPREKVRGSRNLQSTSSNAYIHAVNQPKDSVLSNTSEVEFSNQRKIRRSERSVPTPKAENMTFWTPRNLKIGAQGVSPHQDSPLKSADISPNSAKFTTESLKGGTKSCTKTSSVDDAAQNLLKRLRNNVSLTS